MNTRTKALKVITSVFNDKKTLSEAFQNESFSNFSLEDIGFIKALCFGVLRTYPRLHFYAKELLTKKTKKELLYIIYIGLYQIIFMNVPEHAAIFETVNIIKNNKNPQAKGLVNGVLRKFLRNRETTPLTLPSDLEALYMLPLWMIQKIKTAWPTNWETILISQNIMPNMTLRVNLSKTSLKAYCDKLDKASIAYNTSTLVNSLIHIIKPMNVELLPGFEEGLFSVQDGSAQFVAKLLKLEPGLRILDACAAPGGKTTHILELEPNVSQVLALEISPKRAERINANLQRLKLNKCTTICADATNTNLWWDGVQFDRILIDAPCSGTGVVRRHPDIKYLRTSDEILQFQKLQLNLLTSLWPLLKINCTLVYATCSIFPEENIDVLNQFIKNRTDVVQIEIMLPLGQKQHIGWQILPGMDNFDGFYYCCLKKISE